MAVEFNGAGTGSIEDSLNHLGLMGFSIGIEEEPHRNVVRLHLTKSYGRAAVLKLGNLGQLIHKDIGDGIVNSPYMREISRERMQLKQKINELEAELEELNKIFDKMAEVVEAGELEDVR